MPEKHKLEWKGIKISIIHTPNKWNVVEKLEICSVGRVPIPLTQTGYLTYYRAKADLENFAGKARRRVFTFLFFDHRKLG